MSKIVNFGDKEYNIDDLDPETREIFEKLKFTDKRLNELNNTHIILKRAKNSYISSLKKEIISNKSGFFLENN